MNYELSIAEIVFKKMFIIHFRQGKQPKELGTKKGIMKVLCTWSQTIFKVTAFHQY